MARRTTAETLLARYAAAPGPGAPYAALRDAIRAWIRDGRLDPDGQLPPVRTAAASLGLAPNTVARAYRELEADGWLVGRGRAGTFVASEPPTADNPTDALVAAARVYRRRASDLGFGLADAHRALDEVR